MEKVSGDYAEIYHQKNQYPLERPVTTQVAPLQIDNGFPKEAEVDVLVLRLTRNRAGGHTRLQE